jgi:hypothetical protein
MEIIFDEMIKEANEALKTLPDPCTVIVDSTFLEDGRRTYYLDRLKGYDKIILHMIKMHDYSICFKQNKMRVKDKWVPEEVMQKQLSLLCRPFPRSRQTLRRDYRELGQLKKSGFIGIPPRILIFIFGKR